jgi:hypothetical protein
MRYAGGSFLIGDAEADAVMRYAAALANVDRAATVTVAGLGEDGAAAEFELLIGPASQLIAEPVEGDLDQPTAEAFVAEVERRIGDLTWRPEPSGGSFLDEL